MNSKSMCTYDHVNCRQGDQRMSLVMRKPAICICENKGADQRLCFRHIDSAIPIYPKSSSVACVTCSETPKIVRCGSYIKRTLDIVYKLFSIFILRTRRLRCGIAEQFLCIKKPVFSGCFMPPSSLWNSHHFSPAFGHKKRRNHCLTLH